MAGTWVLWGVGVDALKGETVGKFSGVAVPAPAPPPPPCCGVLVAHRVMEGEGDWEGSITLRVPKEEVLKEGEEEED